MSAGIVAQLVGMGLLARRATHPTNIDHSTVHVSPQHAGEADDDVDGLPDMQVPIEGGRVPVDPDLLPGARRTYRSGTHQGIDFHCHPGTPVLAAASGWVLSIRDEPNLPESRRNEVLRYARALGETPSEVLQILHGRRIVLCHGMQAGKLLTTGYSHLDHIGSGLRPGDRVEQGEVIGEAGSSGTSHAYAGDGWGEVHFELRLDGRPLGEGLAPQDAGDLYRKVFAKGDTRRAHLSASVAAR